MSLDKKFVEALSGAFQLLIGIPSHMYSAKTIVGENQGL